MHEMSIVLSIIDIAEKEASKANAETIAEIELDIGTLSGIEIEALKFAFKSMKAKSILKNANLQINTIQAEAICEKCSKEFNANDVFTLCPGCNSYETKIIKGKEMRVKSLLVE